MKRRADWVSTGARAALEAATIAAAACAALWLAPLDRADAAGAAQGVLWAWAASSVGALALSWALSLKGKGRPAMRAFWAAFGAGILVRFAVLGGMMVYVWRHPEAPAMALLGAYVLAVAVLLLVEARHLVKGVNA